MKSLIKRILLIGLIVLGLICLGILDIVGIIQHGMDYFFNK